MPVVEVVVKDVVASLEPESSRPTDPDLLVLDAVSRLVPEKRASFQDWIIADDQATAELEQQIIRLHTELKERNKRIAALQARKPEAARLQWEMHESARQRQFLAAQLQRLSKFCAG